MGSGLTAVLSDAAASVYEKLIRTDGLPLAEHPGVLEDPSVQELVRLGFAREEHVGTPQLVAVEPLRAIDHAILADQRHLLERYQALLRLRDQMSSFQQVYSSTARTGTDLSELVRVMTDPDEIGNLSVELALSAERDVMSLETAHFTRQPDHRAGRRVPPTLSGRGVRFRNVYTTAVLEIPLSHLMVRTAIEDGWECRVVPDLPMKMVVIDERAALLPLGPTGMEGAMLVRAPVVVAAMRDYFERVWAIAQPVDPDVGDLPAELRDVLALVLTGMTDAAIARHLGISERTVRRHVGALTKHYGATNRVTLAVAVTRLEAQRRP